MERRLKSVPKFPKTVKILKRKKYFAALKNLIDKLSHFEESKNSFVFEIDDAALASSSKMTALRVIKGENSIEKLILGMIREACYKNEMMSAMSSSLTLNIILENLKNLLSNAVSAEQLEDESKSLIELCNECLVRSKPGDLKSIISSHFPTDNLKVNLILKAIAMTGLEGKIVIENKEVTVPTIEATSGYKFDCEPDVNFLARSDSNYSVYESAKVLLVDGIIEKISEIDSLLNSFVNTEEPLVIFARGFGYEVVSTLLLNVHRGTLKVFPIAVPITEKNPNTIVDIAAACNSDIISTVKGEVISTVSFDSLLPVDKIAIKNKECVINNYGARGRVASLVQDLIKRREDMDSNSMDDIGKEMIESRIKSLSSRVIKIILPNAAESSKIHEREKIDLALRSVKDIIAYGKIDKRELIKKIKNTDHPSRENLINIIKSQSVISSLSLISSIKNSVTTSKLLYNIESAVVSHK